VDAKTLRGETSLLRRRLIRGAGLILGTLVAFLIGGVPGLAVFFVFATIAIRRVATPASGAIRGTWIRSGATRRSRVSLGREVRARVWRCRGCGHIDFTRTTLGPSSTSISRD